MDAGRLLVDAARACQKTSGVPAKPSALVDTRVIYCGDNLDQLRKLPDACIDLIYIDPPLAQAGQPEIREYSVTKQVTVS